MVETAAQAATPVSARSLALVVTRVVVATVAMAEMPVQRWTRLMARTVAPVVPVEMPARLVRQVRVVDPAVPLARPASRVTVAAEVTVPLASAIPTRLPEPIQPARPVVPVVLVAPAVPAVMAKVAPTVVAVMAATAAPGVAAAMPAQP
jgi:hypothetical protein